MSQERTPPPPGKGNGVGKRTGSPNRNGGTADPAAIAQHLALLGKDREAVWLRAFFPVGHPLKADDRGRKAQGVDLRVIASWQAEERGVYLVINDGGNKAHEITACRAFWVEWDDRPVEWQRIAWRELGLPQPSFMVATGGKSIHCYWVLRTPIPPAEWRPLQARLLAHAGADTSVKDPSRVLRLAGCSYIRADGTSAGLCAIEEPTDNTYYPWEIEACLPPLVEASERIPLPDPPRAGTQGDIPPRGLEELERLVSSYPTIRADNDQRDEALALVCGLARCMEAIGRSTADAITMATRYHPQAADTFEQVRGWSFEAYSIESFISRCRDAGVDVSRHDLRSRPAPDAGNASPSPPSPQPAAASRLGPTAVRLADLRDYAEDVYKQAAAADRLPLLRDRCQTLDLVMRDQELNRLIWDARRKALGLSDGVAQGQKLSRARARWACEPILLAERFNLVVGLQKTGKTSLLLAMIAAWSKGAPDFAGCKLHGPCPPVLIVGPDMPEADWADMLELAGLMEPDGTLRHPITRLYHAGTPIHLDPEGIEKIAAEAEASPGLLVVCDSYAKLVSGLGLQEKDSDFAYPAYDLMEALAPLRATPVVLHHVGKGRAGESPSMASRGGTALPAAASLIVKIAAAEQGEDGWRDPRRMIFTEGRAAPAQLLVERQGGTYVSLGSAAEVMLERKRQSLIDGLNNRQRQILDEVCLRWCRDGEPVTTQAIVEALGIGGGDPSKTARNSLKQLLRVELVEEERRSTRHAEVLLYRPAEFLRARGNNPPPSEPSEPPCGGEVAGALHDGFKESPHPPFSSGGEGSEGPEGPEASPRARARDAPPGTYDRTRSVLPGEDDPHWGARSAA